MHAANPFLFWSLFSVCGAFVVILGTPLLGAILNVMGVQAVLTESPTTYDKLVADLARKARPYHVAFLAAVLATLASGLVALAAGPALEWLALAAASAATIYAIDRRYGRVEERAIYLKDRLDQGKQDLSLVQG